MTLSGWDSSNTRHARDAEDNAELRRRLYAAEAQLAQAHAMTGRLERTVAKLERELRDASATVDRLAAALAEKGAK